jgi:hypothetical protein
MRRQCRPYRRRRFDRLTDLTPLCFNRSTEPDAPDPGLVKRGGRRTSAAPWPVVGHPAEEQPARPVG